MDAEAHSGIALNLFSAGHGFGMGVAVVMGPEQALAALCEGGVGHTIRFGHSSPPARDFKITRTAVEVRMEERLAAVLADLAKETNRTIGEVLEETVLHTFEPMEGRVGEVVASPHAKATFDRIEALKEKHGLDCDTHANYRFTEE